MNRHRCPHHRQPCFFSTHTSRFFANFVFLRGWICSYPKSCLTVLRISHGRPEHSTILSATVTCYLTTLPVRVSTKIFLPSSTRDPRSVPTGKSYIARIAGSMFAKVLKSATAMFLLSLISSCVSVSPMARQPLSAASTLSSRNIHFSLDLPKSNDLVTTIPPARSINTAFFFSPLFLKPEKIPVIHHPFSIFKTNYATSTQDRPLHALLCCFPTKQAPFHLPAQPSGSFPPPAPNPSSSVPRSPRLRSSLSSSSAPRGFGSTFRCPLDVRPSASLSLTICRDQ